MDAVFYVMAIMGCGDGASACAEARVAPAHYATVQQCEAAMADVLARNTDLDFPVVSAACRRNGAQWVDRGGLGKRHG
ncbi:hypothetical protein ACYZX9_10595 [Sphingomonas citri]|jgi:hypothetical protein|uniref:Lipoprotein n=1 Tax=Sphingomonas citri TaxID=2862499 RepID=A0ABS7BSB1_9SPHN|nr:hypothetical protein [Sphingomonas citri]MBW6532498.1 hypothetical protein [Sphingomonas citri]